MDGCGDVWSLTYTRREGWLRGSVGDGRVQVRTQVHRGRDVHGSLAHFPL